MADAVELLKLRLTDYINIDVDGIEYILLARVIQIF